MASIIPAFADAMQDIALRGHAREVYIWLHEQLDVVTFRPVKHSAIENDLRMRGSAVGWAVNRLLERGYIERGKRDGKLMTYRLVYSRPRPRQPENDQPPAKTA